MSSIIMSEPQEYELEDYESQEYEERKNIRMKNIQNYYIYYSYLWIPEFHTQMNISLRIREKTLRVESEQENKE